jgi:hypothetical protein
MRINRNNYEDFFLLYADAELCADDCKAVEDFIAENEDLRIELEMLQAAVLPQEEIHFADKSFLYKEIVFDSNLQEKLLLKLDAELFENELQSLNSFLEKDTAAQSEFSLLQRTKLDTTEKIIFADKHLLYKKEKDNVVIFRILRWAAAAAIVGFGLFFGVKLISKDVVKDSEIAIINNDKIENQINKNQVSTNTQNAGIENKNDSLKERVATYNEAPKVSNEPVLANATATKIISKKEVITSIQTTNNTITTKQQNEEQLAKNEVKDLPVVSKIVVEDNTKMQIAKTVEKIKQPSPIVNENIVPLENTYAQAVAVTDVEKNENKILYMNEDDVKRTKLGGFFKKIKRVVERTANLKSGNSIQIAGFEIAAK